MRNFRKTQLELGNYRVISKYLIYSNADHLALFKPQTI